MTTMRHSGHRRKVDNEELQLKWKKVYNDELQLKRRKVDKEEPQRTTVEGRQPAALA